MQFQLVQALVQVLALAQVELVQVAREPAQVLALAQALAQVQVLALAQVELVQVARARARVALVVQAQVLEPV